MGTVRRRSRLLSVLALLLAAAIALLTASPAATADEVYVYRLTFQDRPYTVTATCDGARCLLTNPEGFGELESGRLTEVWKDPVVTTDGKGVAGTLPDT